MAAVTGAAFPIAAYSQFIEPHRLTITRLELPIPGLPEVYDGFRIAQLSDFHCGDYTSAADIAAVVKLTNSLQPDMAAITGDFVTAHSMDRKPPVTDPVFTHAVECARVLSALSAPEGIFGCFGNHDNAVDERYIAEVFASFGMSLLSNENRSIQRQGKRLWIAGIEDGIFGTPDLAQTFRGIPPSEPVIMLAHEPDLADDIAKRPVALQLSGHSHGGQIRLPLFGAPYLPALAQKYPFGYYRVQNMHLYTNRGIGTIFLPYRFNAPPEITLITLRIPR